MRYFKFYLSDHPGRYQEVFALEGKPPREGRRGIKVKTKIVAVPSVASELAEDKVRAAVQAGGLTESEVYSVAEVEEIEQKGETNAVSL